MACASPAAPSTKETTNFARLCRLLVDVGAQALRDTFDAIHPPANLHAVLAGNKTTLQSLRARKIINPTQWGNIFPVISCAVSSASFDITLLMVLMRNICGLAPPATGWDALPAATDVSREADIVRVKYFRNTIFAHAEHASVDDATFNSHWQNIRDTLVRLGGVKYRAAIDQLETDCMDPEAEEHYIELLVQWKKDEDNLKEKLDEIGSGMGKVIKKLDALEAASVALKREIIAEERNLKSKEKTHGSVKCKEKYHENEPVEYFCEDCRVCICLKCGQTRHNHHNKKDIQQAAEERKNEMKKMFDRVKAKLVDVEAKMEKQTELSKKSEDKIYSAEKEMIETVEEKIRLLNEHKTAMKTKLSEIREGQRGEHENSMKKIEMVAAQLRKSFENGEDILQGITGPEILEGECAAVFTRCEERLNEEEMEIYKPRFVTYRVNKDIDSSVLGEIVVLQSPVAEGILKEAELESHFPVPIQDSCGVKWHDEEDQMTVSVRFQTGEEVRNKTEHSKDGNYAVRHKPNNVGLHGVFVPADGRPLTGSPYAQVNSHQYKTLRSFESRGQGQGKFSFPGSIAVSEITGNIAIAEETNNRVQLFDSEWKYLRTIGDKGTGAEIIDNPLSVAFIASGNVIVIHGRLLERNITSVFTERGHFITNISKHLINPRSVSVGTDGHLIVCDWGDKTVKRFSPDGTNLIQTVRAPYCEEFPWFAVHHHGMFVVSYYLAHCVKVFSQDGQMLYEIGCKGTGDGQLRRPEGLAIDRFGNLVICDTNNKRLQSFSLEGKFLNSFGEGMECPCSVAVAKNGDLLVCDEGKDCLHILEHY